LKNKTLLIVLILLFVISCSTTKQLKKEIIDQSETNNYFRGIVVYNTKTAKEIINYNGDKYFTPASNTKLFTFYTAYRTFKDSVTGFEYETLSDSLIIKGTADPSFLYGFDENKSLDFLKKTTEGIYLVDENIGEPAYGDGWSWDDYMYYYMPEKNIFPIYGNLIEISKFNDSLTVVPEFFRKNINTNDQFNLIRDIDKNIFYIKNAIDSIERNIPFKTSNQLVADLLSEEIGSKVTLVPNKNIYKFKEFKSVKYDSLYKKMLEESDNFIAEQLMLQVGNKVDSTYSVKKAIVYSLKNYLQNIPQKPRWVDGSGLSRYNLFTPESNVFLLKKMYHEIPTEKLFNYFPAGGKSGTLKNYYKNEKPYIFAKSGTLSNNYNLSGYLVTKKGTILIFSYMNNHYQGNSLDRKKEMEKFFLQLYDIY
jgi:serine-type D-Ala-D-Ala carboxypeptidase/endopeptidase (penicillin-binding protein 4)